MYGIHRVSGKICESYSKVDKIIANVKKVFLKGPYRVAVFKDKALGYSTSPEHILTRWGTWIRVMIYYCEHLKVLIFIIDCMDKEGTVSITNSQNYFSDVSFTANLIFIKKHFGFQPDTITSLETKNIL